MSFRLKNSYTIKTLHYKLSSFFGVKNITREQKLKILLFNPDLFFSEKLKNEVDLKYPAMIVLVTSIILILTTSLTPNGRSLFYIVGSGIVNTYVGWILIASIFYLVSLVFKSNGSFKRTLEFVSYGLIPAIFGHVINLIVHFILRNSYDISPTNPKLYLKSYLELLSNNPLLQAATIIGFLFGLWSFYINVYAVMHARNLSKRNAILTVGIPYFFEYVFIILVYFIIFSYLKSI
jgi:hypothetical protein